jgi:hypothetical protein
VRALHEHISDEWHNDLCRAIEYINSKHSVSSVVARHDEMIVGRWGGVETEFDGEKSVFGGTWYLSHFMYHVLPARQP